MRQTVLRRLGDRLQANVIESRSSENIDRQRTDMRNNTYACHSVRTYAPSDRCISDLGAAVNGRNIARTAVNALGPGDVAAVVYTGGGIPQDFTGDHARLIRAIDGVNPADGLSGSSTEHWAGLQDDLEYDLN